MREKTEVALLGCESYERALVRRRVAELFELCGGPGSFVRPGERVYVKVNALVPAAPEKAVTTHPEVVRAVVERLLEVTGDVVIGDSPGWSNSASFLRRLYERTGFAEVARETGASLDYDTGAAQVPLADGKTLKSFTVCAGVASADHVVSVSKFKTHMFMNISGAVKNLFGAVAGMNKFTYHSRFSRPEEFADLLVDVALAVDARFHVVDAVIAMDGNGPRQGGLVRGGALAGGRDPFAVDLLMMALTGHPARSNRALAAAIDRGLCPPAAQSLPVLGDPPAAATFAGFRLPDRRDIGGRIPGFVMEAAARLFSPRPRPVPDLCDRCGRCVEVCPEGAISRTDSSIRIDIGRCINCYCCHELCEREAISLSRPLMLRLLGIKTGS